MSDESEPRALGRLSPAQGEIVVLRPQPADRRANPARGPYGADEAAARLDRAA